MLFFSHSQERSRRALKRLRERNSPDPEENVRANRGISSSSMFTRKFHACDGQRYGEAISPPQWRKWKIDFIFRTGGFFKKIIGQLDLCSWYAYHRVSDTWKSKQHLRWQQKIPCVRSVSTKERSAKNQEVGTCISPSSRIIRLPILWLMLLVICLTTEAAFIWKLFFLTLQGGAYNRITSVLFKMFLYLMLFCCGLVQQKACITFYLTTWTDVGIKLPLKDKRRKEGRGGSLIFGSVLYVFIFFFAFCLIYIKKKAHIDGGIQRQHGSPGFFSHRGGEDFHSKKKTHFHHCRLGTHLPLTWCFLYRN